MGDRVIIAIYDRDKYTISLYDHWGGEVVFPRNDVEINPEIIEAIHKIRSNSNDVGNFITMLVHWWRERADMKPEDGYTVYLELIPPIPDRPVVAYDYARDSFKLMEYEELLHDIRRSLFDLCDELRDMP